jgi:shikimate kinase
MNLVLIGYRCSGKTTVGKALSRELGRDFVDTDLLIEEDAGYSIETLVSQYGWDHFRQLEKKVVKKVSMSDNLIIATGGGVVKDEDNVKNLRRNGLVIWLKGDAEVLRERMVSEKNSGRPRPSLTNTDPLNEIEQVLAERTPLYRRAGNYTVEVDNRSIREVAAQIITDLTERVR